MEYGKAHRIKIANRLKKERTSCGLTQEELAKKLSVSKPLIVAWERKEGKNKVPSIGQLISLCAFYGCSCGYLLCEHDSRNYPLANIQEATGLSERAINVLKASSVRTDAEDFLGTKSTMTELTDLFIRECGSISEHLERIIAFDTAKRVQDTLHDTKRLTAVCEKIHAETPDPYERWLRFRKYYTKNYHAEGLSDNYVYGVYMLFCNSNFIEAERLAINLEFNRIIDEFLITKRSIWEPTSGFTASKDK